MQTYVHTYIRTCQLNVKKRERKAKENEKAKKRKTA